MRSARARRVRAALATARRLSATTTTTTDAAYVDQAWCPSGFRTYPCVASVATGLSSAYVTFGLPPSAPTLGAGVIAGVKVAAAAVEGGEVLEKSYSPTSHPEARGHFELLVKAYPWRPGGGLGAFLCALRPGRDSVSLKVKPRRPILGEAPTRNRWRHVGCLVAGTGVAPALQLADTLLRDPLDETRLSVLASYRDEADAIGLDRLARLASTFPERMRVHATFTRADALAPSVFPSSSSSSSSGASGGGAWASGAASRSLGRVDAAKARAWLPDPSAEDVLVLVCGTDDFVASMAGPITRVRDPVTGAKHKVQGPTLGVLGEKLGFQPHQVMKL